MRTDTDNARRIMRALGQPPTDYQRALLDVCNGDGGPPWPSTVVVLMPRQVGKTTGLVALALGRGYERADYRAAYTAQRGTVVSERFAARGDGWIFQLRRSAIGHLYDYTRAAGAERIVRRHTQSFLRGFPPVVGRLRGPASDLIVLDEAQDIPDDRAAELQATVVPTMSARPLRQLIVAGTAAGPGWWRDMYDEALDGRHALVEVGTWPADADPDDEAVWSAYHPGLAAGLTDLDALRMARRTLGARRFAREYGNRWDDVATLDGPVPLDEWDASAAPRRPEGVRWAAAGIDVTPNREAAALVTASTDGHVRLRAVGPPDAMPDLVARYAPRLPVVLAPSQGGLASVLSAAGRRARCLTAGEYRAGCQRLHDDVTAGVVSHDGQPELRDALAGAARAWHGDAWVISARRSGMNVAPAVALVAALTGARQVRRPSVSGGVSA